MKTTKEMIEVMQAYDRGEQIEIMNKFGEWIYIDKPIWNWVIFDYRVKPKPKYVPFDTAEEFLTAQRKHSFSVNKIGSGRHYAYINGKCEVRLVNVATKKSFIFSLKGLFLSCKFEDGTPCGKEVEV